MSKPTITAAMLRKRPQPRTSPQRVAASSTVLRPRPAAARTVAAMPERPAPRSAPRPAERRPATAPPVVRALRIEIGTTLQRHAHAEPDQDHPLFRAPQFGYARRADTVDESAEALSA